MANVYSAEYTNATATPSVKNQPSYNGGRVRTAIASYTQGAADGNIGDVVYMCKLPAGATVLDVTLSWGTGNTNETLAVGIVGTAAKFLAATAAATASTAGTVGTAHLASAAGYTTTAETDIIVTNATAAIKAAQKINLIVKYVTD